MQKMINTADSLVADSLRGLALAHPTLLDVDHDRHLVRRRRPAVDKVGLLAGGGSGHEPLDAGYVGHGMLDVAVCGEVFSSPVPDQICEGLLSADTGRGVLQVVKNHSGDLLNFELAEELSGELGVRVATVIVADDVAQPDPATRRGVGLTVLLEKLLGAAAEQGADLDDLITLGRRINDRGRSLGTAVGSCTVPAAGRPTFDLPPGHLELGVGIHGEVGQSRAVLTNAADIADQMVERIIADRPFRGGAIVMLSGLGATPLIEQYVMFNEVSRAVGEHGVEVARPLVGNQVTALDMAGCSLTVLEADDHLLGLWDRPVHTASLRW